LRLTKSAALKINDKHLASFGIKIYLDQAMFSSACLKYGMDQTTLAPFIRLIIRLFQLVFSTETVFFSRNKSANSIFQPAYQHSRTEPLWHDAAALWHAVARAKQALSPLEASMDVGMIT
jgi:hypothetical protein